MGDIFQEQATPQQTNRLFMEKGGQSSASQAVLSPTRLKIRCLHGVIWHSSFQVALKFFSELGGHFFILHIVQNLLQWFQKLCNCVRCSYEQLFLWLYFPRNASGIAFHRNTRTEIAVWQCWNFAFFRCSEDNFLTSRLLLVYSYVPM